MHEAAELLKAIVDLVWALIALWALFAFRKELASVLTRLRRGKVSKGTGIEIELDELDRTAHTAATEAPALSPSQPEGTSAKGASEKMLLAEAVKSPKLALIFLATEIERELRQLLASNGWHRGELHIPFLSAIEKLRLSPDLQAAVQMFWSVRNKLVHGSSADSDDIARAIDSGLLILNTLRAMPRETNIVHHPGVDVYADPKGSQVRRGVKAVVLAAPRPDADVPSLRVYPTTRHHFERGKRVAWEWNASRIFPESWYRDPETGEIKYGWRESMEFVGRHLDEI